MENNTENKRPTQVTKLIKYLHAYGSITQLQALSDLGIMRLASRMSELKSKGINFKKDMVKAKNRFGEKVSFAKYSLVKKQDEEKQA